MGDGKSSAPRVTAKRNTRFHTRASTRSFQIERAPIVLELTSTLIRVGYAESFKPQHIIPITTTTLGSDNKKKGDSSTITDISNNLSESQWYFRLSPIIHKVYDCLMCNPSTRRVVVVHGQHFIPRACQSALTQLLWNKGVSAVSYMSSLEILPVAQGWKRGLIVQVAAEESICACHADGHLLELSYQSVPCGYKTMLLLRSNNNNNGNDDNDDDDDETKLQVTWTTAMDELLLNENNPHSLVSAVLACLERCPRDLRIYVVANLVFCGDGVLLFPELPSKVGKRLKDVLEGTQETLQQLTLSTSTAADPLLTMTVVPIRTEALKPLSDHLAITSCAPHRPDWISWVAASLWAATWNKYDDHESKINWIRAPSDN